MHTITIFLLFLIVKFFQYLTGYIFLQLAGIKFGSIIMIGFLIFITIVQLYFILSKKFFPPAILKNAWVPIVLLICLSALINVFLGVIFIAGLFTFALFNMEAQVLHSFSIQKNIPRLIFLIMPILPALASYYLLPSHGNTPIIFYAFTSLFSILVSYNTTLYGVENLVVFKNGTPPIWLGLFFLGGSGMIYFNAIHTNFSTILNATIPFALLFYIGGALLIYASIDEKLKAITPQEIKLD